MNEVNNGGERLLIQVEVSDRIQSEMEAKDLTNIEISAIIGLIIFD